MQDTNALGRRRFVRQAGGWVAGGLATAALSPATWQQPASLRSSDPQKKLGIALVGLGYYSTDVLAPALQETEHCELMGIVTGTPEKAKAWQDKYGILPKNTYSYDTFEQIADNEAIDIIYIVLPNAMHAEYTVRAAKAGKHVICEKPMATSVADCRAMIKACEENNRRLTIGYRMHFEPHTQEVMRLGQEQVFGPVRLVNAGIGYPEKRADHWKLDKNMGGGAMRDMGVYALQAARYVTGEEPTQVTAQTFVHRPELFTEVDETTMFQLAFPSGAVANLHTTLSASMNYLNVTAQDGWFNLDPFSAYSGITGASKAGPITYPAINQQATQMDEQALSIMNDTPFRVPAEEGLKDMVVIEGIYQAIASGETVQLG